MNAELSDQDDYAAAAAASKAKWERNYAAVRASIHLGIEVEKEDPSLAGRVPDLTDEQISWLASWLVGDGVEKSG